MENNIIKTEVYRKANKFPVHLKSQIPKRYIRNAINGDLYRSWRISSNFYHEKKEIKRKFSSAEYPVRFVNSVINDFESKPIVLIGVPFCNENESIQTIVKEIEGFHQRKV